MLIPLAATPIVIAVLPPAFSKERNGESSILFVILSISPLTVEPNALKSAIILARGLTIMVNTSTRGTNISINGAAACCNLPMDLVIFCCTLSCFT